MRRELHRHQHGAMALLRQSLASGKRRPVLQAPTGFGKTVLAGAIVDGALSKGKRVIITVPALALIDSLKLGQEGSPVVGPDHLRGIEAERLRVRLVAMAGGIIRASKLDALCAHFLNEAGTGFG